MSNTSSKSNTRRLAEGGICIALALVLSYIKIPIGLSFGGFGGSINLVMIPLILFAARWGAPWGLLAGFAFGTLKYFFAEGFAVSWAAGLMSSAQMTTARMVLGSIYVPLYSTE